MVQTRKRRAQDGAEAPDPEIVTEEQDTTTVDPKEREATQIDDSHVLENASHPEETTDAGEGEAQKSDVADDDTQTEKAEEPASDGQEDRKQDDGDKINEAEEQHEMDSAEQLLPVEDTAAKDLGQVAAPSSDEEGVVKGELAPSNKRPRVRQATDNEDEDEDEIVKIENELEHARYDGIDAGTKKRLAVILDFTKVPPARLEDKTLEQLKNLSKADSKEVMKMLDHSVRSSNVRNLSAYLSSMIRRISRSTTLASKPQGTIDNVVPQAREIMQDLMNSGSIRSGDLDGKCLGILSDKPKDVQILIMQLFSSRNLRGVRNMTAYFMAHMRDVDQGLRSGKYRLDMIHEGPRYPERRERGGDRAYRHEDHQKPHYDYVPTSQRQNTNYSSTQYNPAQEPLIPTMVAPNILTAKETPAKHYALEQVQWGVRVDEFQALSPHAKYVHPAAALRLQQLWDLEQNKLVSVLDDNSWLLLAGLDAPNSVKVVNEVSDRMKTTGDDLVTVNRIFVEVASKYPRREDAPPLPVSIGHQSLNTLLGAQATTFTNPVFDPRGSSFSQPTTVNLPGPAGSLPPRVQSQIDKILGNPNWVGKIRLDDFDERVVGSLRGDESLALSVLADFERTDPNKVRNPSAYLAGCIRNAINGPRQGIERGPGGRGHRGRAQGRGGHGRGGPPTRYNPY